MKKLMTYQVFMVFISATLGLTIGLTVMLARPNQLMASPVTSQQLQKITASWQPDTIFYLPKELYNSYTTVPPQVVWNQELSRTQVSYQQSHVLVGLRNSDFFEEVEVGDQLQVLATNNGVYSFSIIEIRKLDQESLRLYLQLSSDHLVLVEHQSAWQQFRDPKFTVVLAR